MAALSVFLHHRRRVHAWPWSCRGLQQDHHWRTSATRGRNVRKRCPAKKQRVVFSIQMEGNSKGPRRRARTRHTKTWFDNLYKTWDSGEVGIPSATRCPNVPLTCFWTRPLVLIEESWLVEFWTHIPWNGHVTSRGKQSKSERSKNHTHMGRIVSPHSQRHNNSSELRGLYSILPQEYRTMKNDNYSFFSEIHIRNHLITQEV